MEKGDHRILWIVTIIILLILAISVLLLAMDFSSGNSAAKKANSNALVLESSNGHEPSVYEINDPNPSDEAWFKSRRDKINDLNAIRYSYNKENEVQLMKDKKMSENWSVYMHGKTYEGYDVIRMEKGDFAQNIEPTRDPVRARAALARGYY